MMKYILIYFFATLMLSCSSLPEMPEDVESAYDKLEEVDYNIHVKPILSENCFHCHGNDAGNIKAGLVLHTKDSAYAELKESPGKYAIVSGNASKSEMVARVLSFEENYMMPTPESHLKLTAKQKAVLIKWIEQGAEYKKHWAFEQPKKSRTPSVDNDGWVTNDIDRFILSKLEKKGLIPSEQVGKEILIRRLSFALRGIPPTLEEVDAYVNNSSESAYEELVDQFLASKHYGERMAIYWLELARYADSDGYLDDKMRNVSPWRDWIINAFNSNMSYKDFVTWQVAGDLIPNKSKESILATAFNRLHKKNSEAGIIFEEFRTEYVADRANTFSKAFLAMSFECARCHDHKYDPISQKNYYQLYSFFNSTNEHGSAMYGPRITPGPTMLLTDGEQDEILDFLNEETNKTKKELDAFKAKFIIETTNQNQIKEDIQNELNKNLELEFVFDKPIKNGKIHPKNKTSYHLESKAVDYSYLGGKKALKINDYGFVDLKYNKNQIVEKDSIKLKHNVCFSYERTDSYTINMTIRVSELIEKGVLFMNKHRLRYGNKGYSLHLDSNRVKVIIAHNWPNNAIEVKTTEPLPLDKWINISMTYDGSSSAKGVNIYFNDQKQEKNTLIDNLYRTISFENNIHILVKQKFMFGYEHLSSPAVGLHIHDFRLYSKALTPLEIRVSNGEQSDYSDKTLVNEFYASVNDDYLQKRKEYKKLSDSLNNIMSTTSEIMVLGDLPKPRKSYILDRGVYDNYGEEVHPEEVAESILEYDENTLPQNRLGLTQWLFDSQNPLTSRVFVNRIWQMHFGTGLVKTSDDFGSQGKTPSHPKLLDNLALLFVESGWDIKALHKKIVMSSTFKQSSKITKEYLDKDPENILLARFPRRRMPAEMIRDNALVMSGLLIDKKGGKSVYPYQPAGLWDEVSNKSWRYRYKDPKDAELYRKSIYTVFKRTTPPPSMMIFDASDRSQCEVQRRPTSTPLQSLVLLNDPQFIEASRVLAEKVIENNRNTESRITYLFKSIIGSSPSEKETNIAKSLYDKMKTKYTEDVAAAEALVSIGEKKRNQSIDSIELAALTVVANSLLNTSEGFTIK
ncbi:MAG: DUF1553 domain-containing protein [Cyclobacteriaceae bacterium]